MAELDLVDASNQKVGSVELSPEVFDVKIKKDLVHQYVRLQLATRRGGNASTISNKGDLHGSGKKPWRQKGTGRARSGNSRSPIWRGGMTVFGPTPRDFDFKMNKKAKKIALRSALTDGVREKRMAVVDKLNLDNPKTKEAVALMKSLELPASTLFILCEDNVNLQLAMRNIPGSKILKVDGLNVFDLLNHDKIVCTPESLKKIEERLN
ncbi:MAG: 50S ribosomal protein L4 [Candidatus Nitrohelix vancouverensis]|uniref:Large ribosomal subunit protein uL4 n=1 Tax=Candidatus Nitrohelix vancouverensis TaxID=2705534 RepID=A0A7T0G2E5_9BACT|nr:MAG: 50S ribosomal protein L4 [Candidatus Nitrohelix vancouverensis]